MKDVKPLIGKQKSVLTFIKNFIRENNYSPSLKEIADFLEIKNLSTAQYYVGELEDKGYLEKTPNKARGISTIQSQNSISLLGFIAAGKPIEPIENPEEINIPSNFQIDIKHPHYALKVKGDSMIDMGILDGDIILVKHQLAAQSGDVIVAITENGATLKVLKYLNGKPILEPRNKDYPIIKPNTLEIRGKFVGLIRN